MLHANARYAGHPVPRLMRLHTQNRDSTLYILHIVAWIVESFNATMMGLLVGGSQNSLHKS